MNNQGHKSKKVLASSGIIFQAINLSWSPLSGTHRVENKKIGMIDK